MDNILPTPSHVTNGLYSEQAVKLGPGGGAGVGSGGGADLANVALIARMARIKA